MTPAQMADTIIKNKGSFGQGDDRVKADIALGKVMEDSLKKGDQSDHDYVKQVNDALAQKGSTFKLDDQMSGGGGRSGSKDNYEEHAEAVGKFAVTDAAQGSGPLENRGVHRQGRRKWQSCW